MLLIIINIIPVYASLPSPTWVNSTTGYTFVQSIRATNGYFNLGVFVNSTNHMYLAYQPLAAVGGGDTDKITLTINGTAYPSSNIGGVSYGTWYIENNIEVFNYNTVSMSVQDLSWPAGGSTPTLTVLDASLLPPDIPTNVGVSGTGGQGTLTWGVVTKANSYNVYENGTNVSNVTTPSYSFNGLTAGSYRFTVSAVNSNGESSQSSPVTYTVSVPGAPTGLNVSGSSGSGMLNWNANQSSENVTNYNIYENGTKITSVTSNSYSFTGLGIGSYSFQVSAENSVGEGNLSSTVNYVYITSPGQVTGVAITGSGTPKGIITWNANSSSDQVLYYNVYDNSTVIASPTTNSYNFLDLAGGLNSFQVSAVNSAGEGPLSNVLNYMVLLPAPSGLSAGNITDSSFKVYWFKESGADSYNVYLDGKKVSNVSQPIIYNPSFDINNLTEGSTHSITVTAVNQWGESEPSQPLSVCTTVSIPVLKVVVNNSNINLSWTGTVGSFDILLNGKQVAQTNSSPYTLKENPGSYQIQVIQNYNSQQYPSNILTVTISVLQNVGAAQMIGDILSNSGAVIAPAGGLLALALALKGSPMLIAMAKAIFLKR